MAENDGKIKHTKQIHNFHSTTSPLSLLINGHFWKICNWNFEVRLAWCLRLRLLPLVLVGQSNYVRNVRFVSFACPWFVPQMSFVYLNFSVFIKCNRKFSITFSITLVFYFPLRGKWLLPSHNNNFRLRGKFWINYINCNLLSFNYILVNQVKNELQKDFEPNFVKITKLSKFRNTYSTNVIYWM